LSSPVYITFDDRIGVYTNSTYQLPVPFQQDHTASLYYSTDVILNNTFTESQKMTVDNMRWRRSFRKYVVFCQTAGERLFSNLVVDCMICIRDIF